MPGNEYTRNAKYILACALVFVCIATHSIQLNATVSPGRSHIVFNSLTVHDGLPQMSVMSIAQDQKGYMWFATRDGLARFDGYRFTTFREEDGTEEAISHNEVTSLLVTKDGTLWAGTRCGLNRFNEATCSFTSFYAPDKLAGNSISRMCEDAYGDLWICTDGGMCRFKPTAGIIDRVVKPEYGSISYICKTLDPQVLVVATPSKAYTYSIQEDSLHSLDSVPDDLDIQALMCDSRGNIWIASSSSGVLVLSADLAPLKSIKAEERGLNNDFVRCFAEDQDGNIIIGTYDGLNIFSPSTSQFRSYRIGTTTNIDALSFFSVLSVFCGNDGTVWLGSFVGGVNYFNTKTENFLNYEEPHIKGTSPIGIVSSIVGYNNILWIGKEGGGLLRYDSNSGEYTSVPLPGDGKNFRENIVNSIAIHGSDLWVGLNNGGVYKLDANSGKVLQHYNMPFGQPIAAIHIDNEKNVYIGTYTRRSGSDLMVISPDGTIKTNFIDSATGKKATFTYISSITEEKDGSLVMGSNIGGLYKYNIHTGNYAFFPLGEGKSGATAINQLLQDRDGCLWVATRRRGLLKLDSEYKVVDSFTHSDGLLSDNICSITRGSDGLLWLTTPSSVASLEPTTRVLRTWQSREVNEFSLRSCYSGDNTIIFGADKGIIRLSPEYSHISFSARKPVIEITNGTEENNRNIRFSCLDYIETGLIRYEYMLDGYDNSWIDALPGITEVSYRNLKPGRYSFKVKAFKGDEDSTGSAEAVAPFRIPFPLWGRWWAICLYIILFSALAAGVMHIVRVKKSMEEERDRLKKICADMFAAQQTSGNSTNSTDEDFMIRFYGILKHKLADQNLSIDYLCAEMGVSRTGLYNKVKKNTGLAPLDFVRRSRLQASIELMKEKRYSIAEIAELVGFGTPSYYCSCFRKEYGCTPKEYSTNNNTNI